MEIEKSFRVDVPVAAVWTALTDLSRVARCLPGAALTEVDADGVHRGTVGVSLGPVAMSFQGEARFDEVDAAARRLVVAASGSERRGRGTVRARIPVELTEVAGSTRVDVAATLDMSGAVAQFGRRGGILEDVSDELIDQFVAELRADILHGTPAPPVVVAGESQPGIEADEPVAARAARATTLNPRTGLWAHIPAPVPAPGSPAALTPARCTPDVVPPWPPPAAPAAPAVSTVSAVDTGPRTRAAAPSLSAFALARKVMRRKRKRLFARLAELVAPKRRKET